MDETQTRSDVLTWFESPAQDFDRAAAFYEAVMGAPLQREDMMGGRLAVFPYQRPRMSGAVVCRPWQQPAMQGVLIYLNCAGRLDAAIAAAEAHGGAVLQTMDLPPGLGRIALIRDPEGNRVGLHSV